MKENVKNFLEKTEFCDFDHPNIQKIAHKIIKNCTDDREKAVSLFYWVRDNILYRVGDWQKKASETLVEKEGACTNKANLLVAFLRANNIPAGYGVMKVDARRYFGPITILMLKKFAGERSTHVYATVYLNNKWIRCDPSDDRKLSENTLYLNPPSKLVEWNGFQDAMLNLDKDHILSDEYPIANIDPWMEKKPRRAKGVPLKVANLFIKFLRENTQKINKISELEELFKNWLKIKYPFYFYSFLLISQWRDFLSKVKKI